MIMILGLAPLLMSVDSIPNFLPFLIRGDLWMVKFQDIYIYTVLSVMLVNRHVHDS